MHKIDMQGWARRELFNLFNTFNHPHFNMCVNMNLTIFLPYTRKHGFSFTPAILYLISKTANDIPEFRHRVWDGEIVEHEIVSPSVTILGENDLFGFCLIDYNPDFAEFHERAKRKIASIKKHPSLDDPQGRDDLLFMTAIPWVSFTSFTHPMQQHPTDSIPRFAWGKYFYEGIHMKMPLSVQGHHALMDGLHMARFYEVMQEYLDHPADVLTGNQHNQ